MPELLTDLYTLDNLRDTLINAINKKEKYNGIILLLAIFFENNNKIDDQISFYVLISECIKEWGLKFAYKSSPILQFYTSTYEKCLAEGVDFKNIQHQLLNIIVKNSNKIQHTSVTVNETSKDYNKGGINEFSGKRF